MGYRGRDTRKKLGGLLGKFLVDCMNWRSGSTSAHNCVLFLLRVGIAVDHP